MRISECFSKQASNHGIRLDGFMSCFFILLESILGLGTHWFLSCTNILIANYPCSAVHTQRNTGEGLVKTYKDMRQNGERLCRSYGTLKSNGIQWTRYVDVHFCLYVYNFKSPFYHHCAALSGHISQWSGMCVIVGYSILYVTLLLQELIARGRT